MIDFLDLLDDRRHSGDKAVNISASNPVNKLEITVRNKSSACYSHSRSTFPQGYLQIRNIVKFDKTDTVEVIHRVDKPY